jgi:hypothetical protein
MTLHSRYNVGYNINGKEIGMQICNNYKKIFRLETHIMPSSLSFEIIKLL